MQKALVFLVSVILLAGLVSIGVASTYTPFVLEVDEDNDDIITPFYSVDDSAVLGIH